MNSSENVYARRSTNGLRLGLLLLGFFLAVASAYWVGIRQTQGGTGAGPKSYSLRLGVFGLKLSLNLTVSQLGFAVIFILVLLLSIAVFLAVFAQHRRREAEAANRKLREEIGERKRAQDQVNRLNAELEQRVAARTLELQTANKELEAFSYSVAHDLRAPLRHINAFAKILEEDHAGRLDSEGRRYISLVRGGAREMGNLVDDLLNLARVSRQELFRNPADLSKLVEGVISDLKAECANRSIKWRVGPLPRVECDAGLMKQVFVNLLSNALKYTRPLEETVIEVGESSRNDERTIFVRDNGVGFDMKHAQKLFGVFQRLHSSVEFEGTGVGLATVQRIVQKHGGRVWAHAEPGKGATFFFTLGGPRIPSC